MLCEVDSGNVTLLLSKITGVEEKEIESLLMSGMPPWVVANYYGKYDEYKDILKTNIAARLQVLIDNNEISVADANAMYNRINQY